MSSSDGYSKLVFSTVPGTGLAFRESVNLVELVVVLQLVSALVNFSVWPYKEWAVPLFSDQVMRDGALLGWHSNNTYLQETLPWLQWDFRETWWPYCLFTYGGGHIGRLSTEGHW